MIRVEPLWGLAHAESFRVHSGAGMCGDALDRGGRRARIPARASARGRRQHGMRQAAGVPLPAPGPLRAALEWRGRAEKAVHALEVTKRGQEARRRRWCRRHRGSRGRAPSHTARSVTRLGHAKGRGSGGVVDAGVGLETAGHVDRRRHDSHKSSLRGDCTDACPHCPCTY